jgi:hypothetical protein
VEAISRRRRKCPPPPAFSFQRLLHRSGIIFLFRSSKFAKSLASENKSKIAQLSGTMDASDRVRLIVPESRRA